MDALDRAGHQGPREVLVGEPFAAFDGVHEVALDRVARRERNVVAALHHPRAAALAEQALDRDRDRQRGIGCMRVQRSEQARAPGAEDEDVGLQPADGRSVQRAFTPNAANARARLARASASTVAYRLPP